MQEENRDFYQEEEYEISLMDLVWYILRQWRTILLTMVILGILLGGYGGLKEFQKYNDREQVQKSQEAYEAAVLAYESQKSQLENKLSYLVKDLEQQKSFEENCLMLQIDPYNVYIHSASYYVNTNYEIAPELFYQNPNYTSVITNSYKSAVDKIDFDSIIATEERPLLTVVNPTTTGKRMVTTTTDSGNGILNITVFADNQERADALFSSIDETLRTQEVLLNTVIGEHSLGLLSEKSYVDVDGDFSTLQDNFANKTATINDGITKTNQELSALTNPVNDTPTIKSVLKQLVKFGIIGALAGFALAAGYFFVQVLLKDRIISTFAIESRYNLPVLGVYHSNGKGFSKVDAYCEKKLGLLTGASTDKQVQYIVSNLLIFQKTAPEDHKVVLIGTVSQNQLQEFRDSLQAQLKNRKVVAAGNLFESSTAVDALGENSIVIDVESWKTSVHKDVQKALRLVHASGNVNAGFVVIR